MSGMGSAAATRLLESVRGGGKEGVVSRTGQMLLRIGYGLGPGCRCDSRTKVSRGRGRHHRQLADLRRQGDAGNGQKGGVVQWYYGNGAEAGKGWWGRFATLWVTCKHISGLDN